MVPDPNPDRTHLRDWESSRSGSSPCTTVVGGKRQVPYVRRDLSLVRPSSDTLTSLVPSGGTSCTGTFYPQSVHPFSTSRSVCVLPGRLVKKPRPYTSPPLQLDLSQGLYEMTRFVKILFSDLTRRPKSGLSLCTSGHRVSCTQPPLGRLQLVSKSHLPVTYRV